MLGHLHFTTSASFSFGHLNTGCALPDRLARCAGPHSWANCNRPRSDVHCTNCGGNYNAEFKQCSARPGIDEPIKTPDSDAVNDARRESYGLSFMCRTRLTVYLQKPMVSSPSDASGDVGKIRDKPIDPSHQINEHR